MPNSVKIQRGMQRQLAQWRKTLAAGDQRLGWKIGYNRSIDQQKFDLPSPMVGYLTCRQQIALGGCYSFNGDAKILVEPEIALLIGADLAAGATLTEARNVIQGYAAALELVDTARTRSGDIEEILAGNLFHEAVIIGDAVAITNNSFSGSLRINDSEVRQLETDRLAEDFGVIVKVVADMLAAQGEQLQAGDWIISGAAATPVEIHAGDMIALTLERVGTVMFTTAEVG